MHGVEAGVNYLFLIVFGGTAWYAKQKPAVGDWSRGGGGSLVRKKTDQHDKWVCTPIQSARRGVVIPNIAGKPPPPKRNQKEKSN